MDLNRLTLSNEKLFSIEKKKFRYKIDNSAFFFIFNWNYKLLIAGRLRSVTIDGSIDNQ